jgi:hypothetical protein
MIGWFVQRTLLQPELRRPPVPQPGSSLLVILDVSWGPQMAVQW